MWSQPVWFGTVDIPRQLGVPQNPVVHLQCHWEGIRLRVVSNMATDRVGKHVSKSRGLKGFTLDFWNVDIFLE